MKSGELRAHTMPAAAEPLAAAARKEEPGDFVAVDGVTLPVRKDRAR